jgi:NADH:ubiquinone oxidoreductase subunit E
MKITICIGSSCHLKGSRQVVEQLQDLVAGGGLEDRIELCGAFCMGNCTQDVSVKIDDEPFSLRPEDVGVFFKDEVLTRLGTAHIEKEGSL